MKYIMYLILACNVLSANIFDFETISSNFKQTITNEENTTIQYTGSFYATSNKKALWIYKKPVDKKIYFSNNRVIIIEPELEQAIVTNLDSLPNITDILKSSKKKSDKLYVANYGDINYEIHINNDKIIGISYKDKLENRVYIEFINENTNIVLDDSLFEATIPKEYDIVTQ